MLRKITILRKNKRFIYLFQLNIISSAIELEMLPFQVIWSNDYSKTLITIVEIGVTRLNIIICPIPLILQRLIQIELHVLSKLTSTVTGSTSKLSRHVFNEKVRTFMNCYCILKQNRRPFHYMLAFESIRKFF